LALIGVATLLAQFGVPAAQATRALHISQHAFHAVPASAQPASVRRAATGAHHPDFNHDGYADLITTVPNDDIGAANNAGSIWAIYGGPHGANTSNRHAQFTESNIGHGATSLQGDTFGWTTAWGDFNHDGFDDLAIGAPGVKVSGQSNAGEVVIIYGSPTGLSARSAQVFTEATSGLGSTPQFDDYFGLGLAAGDFNHDGFTDLAIDAGGVSVHGVSRSGRITELFGTPNGLSHAAPLLPQHFDESTTGIHGGLDRFDDWGRTLASGDFNGDGIADLAVGAPHKSVDGNDGAGVVDILFGSSSGLTTKGSETWTQNTPGVPDSSEASDEWGWSLAVADFNGDHRSDLVIGAPTESQGSTSAVGAATLLYGSAHGLTANGAAFYLLSNITNGQTPAANDQLAISLAPLDFDGDGRPDLALGVSGRTVNGHASAGEIVVLHNVGGRLSRSGGFTLSRDTPGVIGPSAANESFGNVLTPGDFSGNGAEDLAVSLPGLTVDTQSNAGGVQVFYGAKGGFESNDQLFTAPSLGGTAVQSALFGGVSSPVGV
jgi:hypothetical protein